MLGVLRDNRFLIIIYVLWLRLFFIRDKGLEYYSYLNIQRSFVIFLFMFLKRKGINLVDLVGRVQECMRMVLVVEWVRLEIIRENIFQIMFNRKDEIFYEIKNKCVINNNKIFRLIGY